jgi:hypothetical protein
MNARFGNDKDLQQFHPAGLRQDPGNVLGNPLLTVARQGTAGRKNAAPVDRRYQPAVV